MSIHRVATPIRIGESAVVIGASMAGLCAARVLVDRFDQVTVADRDALPDTPTWRRQVPQGRHPHLLLACGARLLDGWFPGILDELYAGGAVEIDIAADMHWYQGGGVARRPQSSLRGPSMSRPFLETTIRTRLESMSNVTILANTDIVGLDLDTSGSRVVAARLADGLLACDLLVDASGRHAHSLAWLEPLGYPSPELSRVEIDTRYMTRVITATQHNDSIALRFNEVVAMIRRPESLLNPKFALRVLRYSRRAQLPRPPHVRRPTLRTGP